MKTKAQKTNERHERIWETWKDQRTAAAAPVSVANEASREAPQDWQTCPKCGAYADLSTHHGKACAAPEAPQEHFKHDACPECGAASLPAEKVPDQTLRGCPNCGHTWFEDLNSAPLEAPQDDDGKLSRYEWRQLAITRYETMERHRASAEGLAEALREVLGAYDDLESGNTITAFQTLTDAKAALAQWEKANQ
jgi:hypothetical protein